MHLLNCSLCSFLLNQLKAYSKLKLMPQAFQSETVHRIHGYFSPISSVTAVIVGYNTEDLRSWKAGCMCYLLCFCFNLLGSEVLWFILLLVSCPYLLPAPFSLVLPSVLTTLIAALIGLLNGSLQKEGGRIYTRKCKLLAFCFCQRWVYVILNSLQAALLERTGGTDLLEETQCNREWHHRNRLWAGITFLHDCL